MAWDRPQLSELKMDAEIGSYQLDDEPRDQLPIIGQVNLGESTVTPSRQTSPPCAV